MQIKRTKDAVVLTAQEVEEILRKHIETVTGREIHQGSCQFRVNTASFNAFMCDLKDLPQPPVPSLIGHVA
jgi:hypothetical protein